MKAYTQNTPPMLYAKHNRNIYNIGDVQKIEQAVFTREVHYSSFGDSFKTYYKEPRGFVFDVQLSCMDQQKQLLNRWFTNDDIIEYTVKVDNMKTTFDATITSSSFNYYHIDHPSDVWIQLTAICEMFFSIPDEQNINDMSIFEIMEHVHKRLLIGEKEVRSIE